MSYASSANCTSKITAEQGKHVTGNTFLMANLRYLSRGRRTLKQEVLLVSFKPLPIVHKTSFSLKILFRGYWKGEWESVMRMCQKT